VNDTTQQLLAGGLLRIEEAETFSGLGRSTLYKHMDDGTLPYVKIGRARRIPKQALIDFVADHLHGGPRNGR
jgi:excisionase family DNA binding protein